MISQENRLNFIAKLQGMIRDCLQEFIADEPISILDFPDIRNPGDSAIWLGQMAYLQRWHAVRPTYVSRMRDFSEVELKRIAPSGPIFIHGGGNFGDIWLAHQNFRERVLKQFSDRQIIQFPQSIHFQSDARRDQCARAIAQHGNFVLLVRDEQSLLLAQKYFDCTVRLCPDMAFCVGALKPAAPVMPVLALLRTDKERVEAPIPQDHDIPTEDWISERKLLVDLAKARGWARGLGTGSPERARLHMLTAAARHRMRRGVRTLSRGSVIVTDRLHVHILSLLLGRPHAVLDNSYGKVRGFIRAFSDESPLVYQAKSLEDGFNWALRRAEVDPLSSVAG